MSFGSKIVEFVVAAVALTGTVAQAQTASDINNDASGCTKIVEPGDRAAYQSGNLVKHYDNGPCMNLGPEPLPGMAVIMPPPHSGYTVVPSAPPPPPVQYYAVPVPVPVYPVERGGYDHRGYDDRRAYGDRRWEDGRGERGWRDDDRREPERRDHNGKPCTSFICH